MLAGVHVLLHVLSPPPAYFGMLTVQTDVVELLVRTAKNERLPAHCTAGLPDEVRAPCCTYLHDDLFERICGSNLGKCRKVFRSLGAVHD